MYYVYVFMQRRMQNSHVIITQLRKLVVPPRHPPFHARMRNPEKRAGSRDYAASTGSLRLQVE